MMAILPNIFRMFKQESPEGGRHVTVQEQPPAGNILRYNLNLCNFLN